MERLKELEEVEELMQGRLNTDSGVVLANQIVEIEAWGTRVSYLLYSAKQDLEQKKAKSLMPKSKEYTDVDRTITMESHVAQYQAKVDYLGAVQDNIKRRVSLGQTLLKALRTEQETGVNLKY